MSSAEERVRKAAFRLVKHAAWVSPPNREEWSRAMLHELDHIPRGASALRWALGCAFVSYLERMDIMTRSLGELPRWLLSIEMAVCLVPLTGLFVAILTTTARGVMPLGFGIVSGSVALLGPVALVVTLRLAHASNARVGRTTTMLLALLAAWTVLAGSVQVLRSGTFLATWRDYVLITLLPALAVTHLLQVNSARRAMAAPRVPTLPTG